MTQSCLKKDPVMPPLGILVTRPTEDSIAFLRHSQRIFSSEKTAFTRVPQYAIQPLLRVSPLYNIEEGLHIPPAAWLNKEEHLIFTSRHGIHFLHALYRDMWPHICKKNVWCVGEATANTAKDSGFQNIRTSTGNGQSLLSMIRAHLKEQTPSLKQSSFVHVCGKDITVDFEKELFPHCTKLILYQTVPSPSLRPRVQRMIEEQRLHVAVLFSKKSAHHLKYFIETDHPSLMQPFKKVHLLTLSQGIAAIFPHNPSSVCITTEDMIKMIGKFCTTSLEHDLL